MNNKKALIEPVAPKPEPVSVDLVTTSDMTLKELWERAKALGLLDYGTKAQMWARIQST